MPEPVAVYPAAGAPIGLSSWLREIAAGTAVTLWPAPLPKGPIPRGKGERILLLPGFSSGDWSLLRLKRFLAGIGYCPQTAHIWINPGPTRKIMNRIESQLVSLASAGKVTVIGVSLGGTVARDLARRFPECVRSVITVCSPVRFPVVTPLAPAARVLARFHAQEWLARRDDIEQPLPVSVTALHAEMDGVVLREQCWLAQETDARNIVVSARHMTAVSHPDTLREIAMALANC